MDTERFIDAFNARVSHLCMTCDCGREFYHDDEGGYDWEPGELEELRDSPKATPLPHPALALMFEGKVYCADCDCWHERARIVMRFLETHWHQCAGYLNAARAERVKAAESLPTVAT